ncbi:MAG: histidine kinase, partial [Methylorubrum extorquens]
MADYYPLLARALDALPDRSPALRRAVYDRARSALIAQLRSLDPPVPEADIDLERKALDTAIGRLEAEYEAPPAAVTMPAEEPAAAAPEAPLPLPPEPT